MNARRVDARVVASGLAFPEGPVVLADGGVLVCEVRGGRLARIETDGSTAIVARTGGGPNGLAVGADGIAYVANSGGWEYVDVGDLALPLPEIGARYSGGRIERVDLDTGAVDVLYDACDGAPLVSPNDLVIDAAGGIWCTDHGRIAPGGRDRALGGVFYCAPDGSSIRRVIHPVDSANGVGLSPDESVLYVADTYSGHLWSWRLDAPGVLAGGAPFYGHGGRLLADPGGGRHFDSLAVMGDGRIVVAAPGPGTLCVFDPDGAFVDEVVIGDPITTNVAFGADEQMAYVTASGRGQLLALDWPPDI